MKYLLSAAVLTLMLSIGMSLSLGQLLTNWRRLTHSTGANKQNRDTKQKSAFSPRWVTSPLPCRSQWRAQLL